MDGESVTRGFAAAHGGKPPAYRKVISILLRGCASHYRVIASVIKKNARKARGFPPCAAAKPQDCMNIEENRILVTGASHGPGRSLALFGQSLSLRV